jgi:hypothetical protein
VKDLGKKKGSSAFNREPLEIRVFSRASQFLS